MGTQLPPEKRVQPPTQILAYVCCGQMAGWIKMLLGTEANLGPGDVVLDWVSGIQRHPRRPPTRGTSPQFSAHVCCDQTAGWMKPLLGTEVDLDPGHIVLDGDPAASPFPLRTAGPPLFSAHVYCGHGRPSQLLLSSCLLLSIRI